MDIDPELFEKIVCYSSLTDPQYLGLISPYCNPALFKNKDIKNIFGILQEHHSKYETVPNVTELKTYLTTPEKKDSLKALLNQFASPSFDKKYNKDFLFANTEKFLREKSVYQTLVKTNLDLQEGKLDSAQVLSEFERACSISLHTDKGLDYLEELDRMCDEFTKEHSYISSGWKWLDNNLGGGFLENGRSLYVFYGETNIGKSIFLGNIAANMLSQNKTVVLVTLEMSEIMYAKRISSHLSQIPISDIPLQIIPFKEYIKGYKKKHEGAKLIVKEFPPNTITAFQLKAFFQQLALMGIKMDAFVLDYLNLLAYPNPNMGLYEGNKRNTELVRALTYVFNCPGISATQTNRSGFSGATEGAMPGLETTGESIGISQTADVQLPIWVKEEERELNLINLGIAKNRFGARDIFTSMEIMYNTLTLKEINNSYVRGVINDMNSGKSLNNTLNTIENMGG